MAQILHTEGQIIEIELKSLDQMQKIVEGEIDFLFKDDFVMIVNKQPKRMKLNKKATEILLSNIYGNTILCNKDEIY